jgi:hypothetical protein
MRNSKDSSNGKCNRHAAKYELGRLPKFKGLNDISRALGVGGIHGFKVFLAKP